MKEGVDHTRRQDFKMWTVHCVKLTISVVTLSSHPHGFIWFITLEKM